MYKTGTTDLQLETATVNRCPALGGWNARKIKFLFQKITGVARMVAITRDRTRQCAN
jgi:hypothetical protein